MTNFIRHFRFLRFARLLVGGIRWLLQNPRNPTADAAALPGANLRELGHTLLQGLPWSGNACGGIKLVGVTSCHGGEGVSTIARLMAATAANSSAHQVLLIDGSVDRPSVERQAVRSQAPAQLGASTGWNGGPFQLEPTQTPNLHVLVAGCEETEGSPNSFDALRAVLADFRERFDLVVLDIPALTESQLVSQLVSHLDGIVLVVGDERIRRETAQRSRAIVERSGGKILGIVLNKERNQIPAWLGRVF